MIRKLWYLPAALEPSVEDEVSAGHFLCEDEHRDHARLELALLIIHETLDILVCLAQIPKLALIKRGLGLLLSLDGLALLHAKEGLRDEEFLAPLNWGLISLRRIRSLILLILREISLAQ